jgi:hypothetical protein
MANARTRFDTFASYLQRQHNATLGQFYGKPAVFWRGEPIATYYKEAVAFRLNGRALTQALTLSGTRGYDPLHPDHPPPGWPGWVYVPVVHFLRWDRLCLEAMRCLQHAKDSARVTWEVPPGPPAPPADQKPPSPPDSLANRVASFLKGGLSKFTLSR